MALTQRRVVEIRRIVNETEYRAALARIDELASAEDIESVGKMEALPDAGSPSCERSANAS